MNNKEQIDKMPKEMLLATRKLFLGIIESGRLEENVNNELRELVLYIETKLKRNNVSLNTPVSQADMEKAQKYMGGVSGINNNNNYYENDSDGIGVVGGFVGVVIVLSLIASFFNWLGGVISDLWAKGIIQMILTVAGIGGTSYGIYKLYENGFFENIEKYFEKKKIENGEKQKSISKVKSNEKVITAEKEKTSLGDRAYKFIRNLAATTTAITILGTAGYHIVDKNEFNGQKLSLTKVGRLEDVPYYPQQEFNINWEVLINSKSSKNIMYDIPEERSWYDPNSYILDNDNLKRIVRDNILDVNHYIRTGTFSGKPKYYHLDKTMYTFLDDFNTELIEVFNDYRNAIVYYASNNMREELENTIKAFYIDCHLMFIRQKTYELGNPIVKFYCKFDDASYLAKIIVLEICDSLLDINYINSSKIYCYSTKLERGYDIDVFELREVVKNELSNAKNKNKSKKHVRHYWLYE